MTGRHEYDVKIHELNIRKGRPRPYLVRWVVAGERFSKAFATRALADNYRSQLLQAVRKGEGFDRETGLPDSLRPEVSRGITWFEHACRHVDVKWPHSAGKTRSSTADALATITPVLVTTETGRPPAAVLRKALVGWAFNPTRRAQDKPARIAAALAWIEKNSVELRAFNDVQQRAVLTRQALDACALCMDGRAAAATTFQRKRAVLYNVLGYAVELGHLSANPVDTVQWSRPHVAETVDRRVVASPAQVRALLVGASYSGRRVGERLVAFFALLYFAAMRPSEALALRQQDCDLPEEGWGTLTLARSRPEVGKAWSDDGQRTQRRSLKWRGIREVRRVPIPPELVGILRSHIERFGVAGDGRLFRTATGGDYVRSAYYRVWKDARSYAFPPTVVDSPLAGRPYDLRHGGVTLWLNSGVPAPEVARRAGHSVDVLLRIYAGCIDGQEEAANTRIEDALRDDESGSAA